MSDSSLRPIKRLANRQAAELLGEDVDHKWRARSAEGIRYAFSTLSVPGFSETVRVEQDDPIAAPQEMSLDANESA